MGYWLAAHPRLHYVHLPIYKAWVEWVHASGSMDKLLVAHKVGELRERASRNTSLHGSVVTPWRSCIPLTEPPRPSVCVHAQAPYSLFGWLLRHSSESWQLTRSLQARYTCGESPPCHSSTCAHQPGQRVCQLSVRMNASSRRHSVRCNRPLDPAVRCTKACHWRNESIGHRPLGAAGSGGDCVFHRSVRIPHATTRHVCQTAMLEVSPRVDATGTARMRVRASR